MTMKKTRADYEATVVAWHALGTGTVSEQRITSPSSGAGVPFAIVTLRRRVDKVLAVHLAVDQVRIAVEHGASLSLFIHNGTAEFSMSITRDLDEQDAPGEQDAVGGEAT